ncbi:capsule biosynthesis protein [Aliiroseovarius sp. PTFE2010]|uniref:capsule biosynthesis protein n=1 Tax=Aliiroseovarius sp. PTFE2010 TaxID=3417190 RepID=UPI003CF0E99F
MPEADTLFDNDDDGFGAMAPAATKPAVEKVDRESGMSVDQEIDAIRKEGLTGRQLRMARRVAQKHGIAPTSDFDAVRLLRKQGVDPFSRATMLELVQPAGGAPSGQAGLPQTVSKPKLPATPVNYDPATREAEIGRIQRDIVKRRRRKMGFLGARLGVFVLLPTLFAGYYFYFVATPMYATQSEFVIQQAEPASAGGMGGLFSGTGFATSQDSIAVQSYLESRDAMLRLNEDHGFKAHFSAKSIDPIQRLTEDASNEAAYKLFQDNVTIGYDPTEGIIKMEVVAADPEISAQFNRALITYAEERVDKLTQRLREDQMQGARESFDEAEAKMIAAQERVLELQEQLGVLDPVSESTALMAQIGNFETQLQEKKLQLDQLLDNARPNQARVDGVRGDIGRLENVIESLRSQLTQGGTGNSLARTTSQLRVAEVDLQTRQMMMQQALQQLESARSEANRQVRYLSEGVSPVAPDEPTYPRKFENTVLTFLIFSGIYLMVSLTASVLREQVSA